MNCRFFSLKILSVLLAAILGISACANSEQKYVKHMERAQAKYDEGDFSTARIEIFNAIRVNPSSSEAYYLAAKTMTRLQDYQGAYSAYESAVELDPENMEILLDYVTFLLSGKGYDRAVSLLREALEKNPVDPVLRRLLSRALAGNEEKIQAVDVANRLVSDQPESVENWLNLVKVNLLANDNKGAQRALEKAREVSSQDDPRVMLAEVDLLLTSGQLDAAAENLMKLGGRYPENTDYAVRLGYVREMMARTEEAISVYRAILQREDNPMVRNRLALLLSQKGADGEAIAQWEDVLEGNSRAVEPRLGIARVKLKEGDQTTAWQLVGESLEIDDGNPEALALRGIMSIDRDDFSGAVMDLERAVSLDPGNSQWRLALADAYLGKGDIGGARKAIEEVLISDQENARAHLILARILVREGLYSESSLHAEKAAAADQLLTQALEIQGNNALAEGDPQKAVGLFEKALNSAPDNPGLRIRLATALGAGGDTERAVGILKKLLEERPGDLLPLTVCTGILRKAGRVQEALSLVHDHYSNDSPGHGLLLAETLEKAGEKDQAEKAFRSVVERSPDFGPAYYRVVAFYSRDGRLDEARKWLEHVITKKKEGRYGLYHLLGMLWEAGGNKKAAVESYRAALKENPDFVPALNNLAWALAEEGKLDEAIRISSKGRVIDPANSSLADTHGWILYLSGNAAGALPLIRQAAADQTSNRAIREHLVEVLYAVGRTEEAEHQREILKREE